MNNNPQQFMPGGGGFGFRGGFAPFPGRYHEGGPNALQWVTFALVLLLVLAYFGTLISFWATRRAYANAGGPPPWMGRRRFKQRYWTEQAPPPHPPAPPEDPPTAA